VIIEAEKIATNLYILIGDTLQEETTMTWHHKLGHMSECGLKILLECNLIPELKSINLPFYEHSIIIKQHRFTFGRPTA